MGRILYLAFVIIASILFIVNVQPTQARSNCDPSYPNVCIAPAPPDLDCGDVPHRNFRVVGSDPHRFDRDRDGIGCEA
ncbi:hypothetical protein [Leptolyngbya ohadii]|uniref:hypothetical protein n=1 Tax=Leptolyngbya ohadii TaxID=1962290 RepID=UPI000B5A09AD|nr:hypothetical protein [Leptolyngbya ohadii]